MQKPILNMHHCGVLSDISEGGYMDCTPALIRCMQEINAIANYQSMLFDILVSDIVEECYDRKGNFIECRRFEKQETVSFKWLQKMWKENFEEPFSDNSLYKQIEGKDRDFEALHRQGQKRSARAPYVMNVISENNKKSSIEFENKLKGKTSDQQDKLRREQAEASKNDDMIYIG